MPNNTAQKLWIYAVGRPVSLIFFYKFIALLALPKKNKGNRGEIAMSLLQWGPKYSVNIAEIDQQHQKLFNMVNTLYDAMSAGRGKDVLGKVLTELAEYTVYHFGTEEKLFQTHGYPESAAHKAEHEKLLSQVRELKSKFDAGKTQITLDVMNFLKDWLNNHIMVVDKKYSPFLNGKGVK